MNLKMAYSILLIKKSFSSLIFIRIFYKLTSQQRCRKANIQKVMLLTPHKIYDRQHQQVPHKRSEDICHQVLMVDTKFGPLEGG